METLFLPLIAVSNRSRWRSKYQRAWEELINNSHQVFNYFVLTLILAYNLLINLIIILKYERKDVGHLSSALTNTM